ncbi:MAG: response regulator [Verrucomicrobiota bacterium]
MPSKVLIVDDEPYMLRIIEMSLRKGGHQLIVGRNGREAVDLARRERPKAIVMDVLMPEMDGLQALRELRTAPETAETPVIMLTARGQVITRQEAAASGANLFLTKPFSPTQLLAEVDRLVARPAPAEAVLTGALSA